MVVSDAESREVKDDSGSLDVLLAELDDTGRKTGLKEVNGLGF